MINDKTRVGKISQQMMTNLDTQKIQLGNVNPLCIKL